MRAALPIRGIDSEAEPDLTFGIATTRDELETAYRLLHDCYVGAKLMDPHPSGLRCNIYSALPYTTTIIARKGTEVIGTVSLIKDSPIGFPSDKEYRRENDSYRAQGYRMVEVSALAVDPRYREDHRISLHMMKYLYEYAHRYMDCDLLCATVHPRAYDFYAALLGFQKNGDTVSYGFVKGALAIHITLDLDFAYDHGMKQLYARSAPEHDLYGFMVREKAPFTFPNRDRSCVLDPVMTPEMLHYFFDERTSLFSALDPKELALIRSAYDLHFDMSGVPGLQTESNEQVARAFRYPMRLSAVMLSPNGAAFGEVQDISTGGLFIQTRDAIEIGAELEAVFSLGEDLFRLPCVARWHQNGKGKLTVTGYGINFLVADLRLVRALRSLHLNIQALPRIEDAA